MSSQRVLPVPHFQLENLFRHFLEIPLPLLVSVSCGFMAKLSSRAGHTSLLNRVCNLLGPSWNIHSFGFLPPFT
jgi:hypothetical protein